MQCNCSESWWHFHFSIHTIVFFSPAHQCIMEGIASPMALANNCTNTFILLSLLYHSLAYKKVIKDTEALKR